jgi:hypothetical protein
LPLSATSTNVGGHLHRIVDQATGGTAGLLATNTVFDVARAMHVVEKYAKTTSLFGETCGVT